MVPAMGSITPPPPGRLHTPPTPKHGFSDNWEPFSPRKSARLHAQRTGNRTPPPRNSNTNPDSFGPAKTLRAQASSSTGIISPLESPKKKARTSAAMDWDDPAKSARRLTAHDASEAAAALGPDKSKTSARRTASATIESATGMLPTPAKTPKKASAEKNPAIQGVARNLFASDEELMPSRRGSPAKKYTGVSLDSFRAEDEPIEIFTDSKERIPEKEMSADNPFYGDAGRAGNEPMLRRSKRRHVHVPGEGHQTIEEAMKREDGLVYVFRGKKMFRKFAEAAPADAEDDDSDERSGSPAHRHMTRSSIKPRILFPPKQRSQAAFEEEEADTDIEADTERKPAERNQDQTQYETPGVPSKVDTPAAPGYSPASPPDTRRVTRARDKKFDEDTPGRKARGQTSPFDSWPRVKSRSDAGASTKRAGSSLSAGATKKMRS